jgi:hypothetical protein
VNEAFLLSEPRLTLVWQGCVESSCANTGSGAPLRAGLGTVAQEIAEKWNVDSLDEEGLRSLKAVLSQRVMLAEVDMAIAWKGQQARTACLGQYSVGR